MNKVNVALGLAKLSVPKKIEKGRLIVTSMTGNTNFSTPVPSLASVTAAINALETAHIAALHGGVDDTANMHAKEYALDLVLKQLSHYVEAIASANLITAEAVILGAGMGVKERSARLARDFDVTPSLVPGQVKVSAKSAPRATFIFEMSVDEENWEEISFSPRSRILKSGLVSGTRYYFRVTIVDKNGKGLPSHVLSTVVL